MHGEGRSGAGTQRTTREPVSEGEMALSGLARRIAGGRDSGAVKKLASVSRTGMPVSIYRRDLCSPSGALGNGRRDSMQSGSFF